MHALHAGECSAGGVSCAGKTARHCSSLPLSQRSTDAACCLATAMPEDHLTLTLTLSLTLTLILTLTLTLTLVLTLTLTQKPKPKSQASARRAQSWA